MRALVIGAGGMLGMDLRRAAEAAGHEVVALDRAALDVTDGEAVRSTVADARPDAVFNCAAWTDVDGAEGSELEALRINGDGARNVAASAAAAGATIVLPSTDYVFDGTADRPYVESDPTAPISAYGRTKLVGEQETAAVNPRHFVVRTSWLFGRGGRNFVETMLGLADRGEATVVSDQVGCPTYTPHLAEGLLRLAATDQYGIHHMSAAGHVSWHGFAQAIFEEAGIDCRVLSTTTAELARPAPRPAWSVLDTEWPGAVRLPDWRDGLRAYLAARTATVSA
jgi:dTDP-4-dehydrorhamnose reductase